MVSSDGEGQFGYADVVLMHFGDATMVQMTKSLMPKDTEGILVQVVNEKKTIVGIIEAAHAGSWRWFRWNALSQRSDNGVLREVAVNDFVILIIVGNVVGRNRGSIDSMDSGRDFVFGKEISG